LLIAAEGAAITGEFHGGSPSSALDFNVCATASSALGWVGYWYRNDWLELIGCSKPQINAGQTSYPGRRRDILSRSLSARLKGQGTLPAKGILAYSIKKFSLKVKD